MACLRRLTLIALVWLTAASTLLAGVPHFDCLCPDGRRSSYCLGKASRKTTCCCGGACCANGQGGCCAQAQANKKDEPDATPHCCQQQTAESEKSSATHGDSSHPTAVSSKAKSPLHAFQLKRASCKQTLSQAKAIALAPSHTSITSLTTIHLSIPLPVCLCLELLPSAVRGPGLWLPHVLPPPTDLVIALQHFLI